MPHGSGNSRFAGCNPRQARLQAAVRSKLASWLPQQHVQCGKCPAAHVHLAAGCLPRKAAAQSRRHEAANKDHPLTDVAVVVDSHAAYVHGHAVALVGPGAKRLLLPTHRVVQLQLERSALLARRRCCCLRRCRHHLLCSAGCSTEARGQLLRLQVRVGERVPAKRQQGL